MSIQYFSRYGSKYLQLALTLLILLLMDSNTADGTSSELNVDSDLVTLGDGNCTIRSTYYNEYLYTFWQNDDSGDRAVYTWKPSEPFIEALWDLKPLHNENNLQFSIRNIAYDGYHLVQKTDSDIFEWKSLNDRRNIHAASRKAIMDNSSAYHSLWELEPLFINSTSVYKIRNPFRNEYLYAVANDLKPSSDKRRVFTWIPGGATEESYWDIQCNVVLPHNAISVEQEETVINLCVTQIINGQYQSAVEEFKKVNSDTALVRIINEAYGGNVNYIGNVIDFLGYISSDTQICAAYAALLNGMIQNDQLYHSEITRLAYRIKEATEQNWCATAGAELEQLFEVLQNTLPIGIKSLEWNGNCTIRSTYFNEYLYAFWQNEDDSGDRAVYTWKPSEPFIEGLWNLRPLNNGNNLQFSIRNIAYDGFHLVQRTNRDIFKWKKSSQRRNVHVATRNSIKNNPSTYHSIWEMEPVVVNTTSVYKIRNPLRNEYLYAAANGLKLSAERRRVFTWIPGGANEENYWDIKCNVKL